MHHLNYYQKRQLLAANREIFNILKFGATGGADDSAAVEAAALAASVNGGTVYIPQGTWHFDNITVYDNVRYQGESKTATTVRPVASSTNPVFKYKAGLSLIGCSFCDMYIFGNGSSEGHGVDLTTTTSISEITFVNLKIEHCNKAISGINIEDTVFENNDLCFNNIAIDPVSTSRYIPESSIDNCNFASNTTNINGLKQFPKNPLERTSWNKIPGFILIGDSTAAQQNKNMTLTGATASGTTITATFTAHGLYVGQIITVQGFNQSEYNGYFRVTERTDANNFKYQALTTPSVSPATGTGICVVQQNVFESNYAAVSSYLSQGKGLYLGNYAYGGAKTSDLDSQLDIALTSGNNLWNRDVDICFISCGINDALNSVASSVTIANLKAAIERLTALNIIPVVLTTMPINGAHGSFTETIALTARAVNKWIRESAPPLGAIVIDAFDICSDNTTQYGDWKTNYSSDGLHPQKIACLQIAKNIKTNLWDHMTTMDDRSGTSIAPNAQLSGTGGTASGTGASGDVADSMVMESLGGGSQTVVGAKGVGLSGDSLAQRMTISGAAANDRGNLKHSTVHASVANGDRVVCRFRFRTETDISAQNVRYISLKSVVISDGDTSSDYTQALGYNNYSSINLGESFDMLIETPPLVVGSETLTSVSWWMITWFGGAGSIVADLSDHDIVKY